jgi:hypothetical protein
MAFAILGRPDLDQHHQPKRDLLTTVPVTLVDSGAPQPAGGGNQGRPFRRPQEACS